MEKHKTEFNSIHIQIQINFKVRSVEMLIYFNFLCQGACPKEMTGYNITQGIFSWNETGGNRTIFINCPFGHYKYFTSNVDNSKKQVKEGKASRYCQCNNNDCQDPSWLDPDTSQCKYQLYDDSEITKALSALYQVFKILTCCVCNNNNTNK